MMDSISQHGRALIVVLVLAVVVVAVIIAADVSKKARARGELRQQQFVGVAPQQWFQQLFLEIGGLRNRAVTMQTSDAALITTTYIPGWTLIPIILLFPIGLLFLLVKGTHTTTVLAMPQGTGTVIQINGYLDDRLRNKLQELEKRLGAIPAGTVDMPTPPLSGSLPAPAPATGPWPVSPGPNNPPPPVEAAPEKKRESPQP